MFTQIRDQASEKIKTDATQSAIDNVVSTIVGEEVARRTALISNTFITIREKNKELGRIKADIITYDKNGKATSESWSKVNAEKRTNLKREVEKLEKALTKAVVEGDYSGLTNVSLPKENKETKEG